MMLHFYQRGVWNGMQYGTHAFDVDIHVRRFAGFMVRDGVRRIVPERETVHITQNVLPEGDDLK